MKPRAAAFFIIFTSFALVGCDKNPLGTVESQGHPPVVSQVVLTPNAVYIDTLTPNNGLYHLSGVLSAKVGDIDGPDDIRVVQGDMVDPSGEHLFTVAMQDNGVAPDSSRGDGVYSARINLSVTRAMAGRYFPFVTASDGSGLQSNGVASSLLVFRRNSPPTLSDLVAPDTLRIPAGGSASLFITVAASDSDGLADIKEVFFVSPDGTSPQFHFILKDDGGETQPASNDATAGDGVFSILLPLTDSPTIRGRYRFLFQARDGSGDTSATLLHNITVM
jgi:hypothetical protein